MLSKKQVKYLKGLAHHLTPTVMVGKAGFSEAVCKAMSLSFKSFELIKVKIAVEDRIEVASIAENLAFSSGAELVQIIGKMGIYYKKALDQKTIKNPIIFPNSGLDKPKKTARAGLDKPKKTAFLRTR